MTISGGVNISSTQLSHKSSEVASANKNRGSSAFLQQKLVGHSRTLRGTRSDTVIEKDSDCSFLFPLMGFQRFRKLYESKRCTRKHKRQNRKLKMSDIPCAKIPRYVPMSLQHQKWHFISSKLRWRHNFNEVSSMKHWGEVKDLLY